MVYKPAKIDFTDKQIQAMVKGKPVRLSHSQIGKGEKVIMLHPENHLKLSKAYTKGRGCVLHVADGEINATHESDMEGTGFFKDLWKGVKKVFGVLKDSGALTTLADMAVAPLSAITGQPALVNAGRKIVKDVGGFGVCEKQAAPIKKRARVSRKTNSLMGGSMLLPSQ